MAEQTTTSRSRDSRASKNIIVCVSDGRSRSKHLMAISQKLPAGVHGNIRSAVPGPNVHHKDINSLA